MLVFFGIVALLLILFILSTVGRTGQQGLQALRNWSYAHRGLHGNGVPENSMEAFNRAKNAGYGIELDVHLLSDGNLAVIHDSALKRTTGASGCVEDLTIDELHNYGLENTDETIPAFHQVLDLISGQVPLIVELKSQRNNYSSLCAAACKMLDDYDGMYCIESFDPRCIYWLRKNRPSIIRGQLTENYFSSRNSKFPWYLKFTLTNQMLNFLTLPDFVAYRFKDRKSFSNVVCRKLWGIQGVSWTLKNLHEYEQACSEGWLPIFEGFEP